MKKSFFPIVVLVILVSLVGILIYYGLVSFLSSKKGGFLHVSFLSVGQGDATFVESPQGTQMLIDGGRDASVLRELPRVMGHFDRSIDVVLATHPDADHIGGLIEVLKRYEVNTIVMTNNVNDTPAYYAFVEAVKNEDTQIIFAGRGQVFDLGVGTAGSTTLTILFPDRDVTNLESNMSSIVAKLSYGDADFLLTGDSPQAIETYLTEQGGSTLGSEVLKVGHHGSRTSTAATFVAAVHPLFGIISAGKDNDYGHPHREVLDTLASYGVQTKNTADLGSILIESDGEKIWFK